MSGPRPWSSGPAEILQHGLNLLKQDTDTSRRLAMLSIDNAVELIIKTYLGLPRRVTGIQIKRADFEEISESFPKLLDALERHAAPHLVSVDLAEIEWFHRLRNQLYHEGNGLTVEREQVQVYGQLARNLFRALFGHDVTVPPSRHRDPMSAFISLWARFESVGAALLAQNRISLQFSSRTTRAGPGTILRALRSANIITVQEFQDLTELREIRNKLVHRAGEDAPAVDAQLLERMLRNLKALETRLRSGATLPFLAEQSN